MSVPGRVRTRRAMVDVGSLPASASFRTKKRFSKVTLGWTLLIVLSRPHRSPSRSSAKIVAMRSVFLSLPSCRTVEHGPQVRTLRLSTTRSIHASNAAAIVHLKARMDERSPSCTELLHSRFSYSVTSRGCHRSSNLVNRTRHRERFSLLPRCKRVDV